MVTQGGMHWPHGNGMNTTPEIFFQPQTDKTYPCCVPYVKPAPQAPAFECSVFCQGGIVLGTRETFREEGMPGRGGSLGGDDGCSPTLLPS